MIVRAVLTIAIVALFIPHEPDLGFGRPGANLSPKLGDWAAAPAAAQLCANDHQACANGLDLIGDLRGTLLSNLERVKSELKHSEQARDGHRRDFLTLAARWIQPGARR